ncbi:MAG: CHASE2 domain-containing protein [Thermoleophilia bacterium]|nr:CHASE2 domain-containing protein [Thermoleophilia bacterium]
MSRRVLLACGVALLAAVGGLAADASGLLQRGERDTVDLRFAARGAQPAPEVVVVGIDDVTFGDLGVQWPFPRSLHGEAIDALRTAGAGLIVYDVQFTEASKPAEDLALYDAVARAPGTILATSEIGAGGTTNILGGDANLAEIGAIPAASHLPKDGRGVIRRFQASVDGLDTIAGAVATAVHGRPIPAGAMPAGGALIDYRGGPGTIAHIPFSEVIDPDWTPPEALRGAIVVVGATAPSLQDVHLTPAGSDNPMSGPEVQANAIWTALHDAPLREAPLWADLLAIVGLGVFAPLLSIRVRFSRVAAAAGVVAVAYVVLAFHAFGRGTVLEIVEPLVALAVGTLAIGLVSHLTETRERRRAEWLNAVLEEKVRERTAQLRATQLDVVHRLSAASEQRDNETGLHIVRMSRIAEALALAAGIGPAEAEELRDAAVLHDIGKLGVPDYVLLKDGRLTDEEREIMKLHTLRGADILAGSESPLLQLGEMIARTHHERWDGTGYPLGTAGDAIPLPGRICAIADVFDALVSVRRYKAGWPLDRALDELRLQRGRQFDPHLVDVFLTIAPELYEELGYARDTEAVPAPA